MSWSDLNIKQKYELMKQAQGSYTKLSELKDVYNTYSLGGQIKPMWSKVKRYYNRLVGAGIPANAALGIVGNIAQESAGDPNAHTSGTSYYGLVQNHYSIRDMIAKRYGNYNANSQIQFLIDGWHGRLKDMPQWLQNRFTQYRNSINRSETTPYQAALNWNKYYERAVGQQDNKRGGYAAGFAKFLRYNLEDYNNVMNNNISSKIPEGELPELTVTPEDSKEWTTDLIPEGYETKTQINPAANNNSNNTSVPSPIDDYYSYMNDMKQLDAMRTQRLATQQTNYQNKMNEAYGQ